MMNGRRMWPLLSHDRGFLFISCEVYHAKGTPTTTTIVGGASCDCSAATEVTKQAVACAVELILFERRHLCARNPRRRMKTRTTLQPTIRISRSRARSR